MTHIYASNLQRAVKTAQAIAGAQSSATGGDKSLEVIQVPELREKDFGSDEGKRFGTRRSDQAAAPSATDLVPSETQEAMKIRTQRFIDNVFVPMVAEATLQPRQGVIVVVAHGIILNVLLRSLLTQFGPDEVAKLSRPGNAPWRSEWLATWSNTGYLEAVLRVATPATDPAPTTIPETSSSESQDTPVGARASHLAENPGFSPGVENQEPTLIRHANVTRPLPAEASLASTAFLPSTAPIIQLSVKTVNYIEHLQGLKKTRGGIGSAASDSKQKRMDSFFSRLSKKPKIKEGDD